LFQFPDEPTRQQKRDAKELVSTTVNPTNLSWSTLETSAIVLEEV